MNRYLRIKPIIVLLAAVSFGLVSAVVLPNAFAGQEHAHDQAARKANMGHSHAKAGGHGGTVTMTKEFHFEVAFHRESVELYLYDSNQNPISAEGVSGTIDMSFRDGKRKPVKATLSYAEPVAEDDHVANETGHEHGSHDTAETAHPHDTAGHGFLRADVDLARVLEGDVKAVFELKNLPGTKEKEVNLKQSFELARLVTYECPMNCVAPAADPGNCPKCHMAMKRTESIFACSMHPNVTSQDPNDTCWLCGMKVSLRGESEEQEDHDDGHSHKH